MPKVASKDLVALGQAVRAARSLKGLGLKQLGANALGRDQAQGYLSKIENGKRQISVLTAGKLITYLDLPRSLLDPFLLDGAAEEDEITTEDRDAERLIRRLESDHAAPSTAEALLITLAYEFANGSHIDLPTAYSGLRSALQAADSIKSRGALPQNLDDQLQAVMQEVARLNDLGQREEAATALDDAMKRVDAERDAIFALQLNQDRVLNRPETAANRLIQDLHHRAPAGGIWAATRDLILSLRKRANDTACPSTLRSRAISPRQITLVQRARKSLWRFTIWPCANSASADAAPIDKYLRVAIRNFQEVLRLMPRTCRCAELGRNAEKPRHCLTRLRRT